MHTKEPWYVSGTKIKSRQKSIITEEDTAIIECFGAMSGDDTTSDRFRIVAAVNACAGITTEALEGGVVKEVLEALKDIVFQTSLEKDGFTVIRDDAVVDRARAAIAKAEGEEGERND